MKTRIIVGALLALITTTVGFATPALQREALERRLLAAVQQATAKYHDVDAALADGYVPVSPCEELPGEGAMGIHYLHPQLAADLTSAAEQPEILLYMPKENGELELVGVEYWQAAAGRSQAPAILDQPFDGPMPGHAPGMPEHFDLHVWLWEKNPNGLFAAWNPALSCGGEGATHAH